MRVPAEHASAGARDAAKQHVSEGGLTASETTGDDDVAICRDRRKQELRARPIQRVAIDQIGHFPKPLRELADRERRPYPADTAEREPENSMQPRSVWQCGVDHGRLRIKPSIQRRRQATSKADQLG